MGSWLVWTRSLSGAMCDDLISKGLACPSIPGTVGFTNDLHRDDSYRKSDIRWLFDHSVANLMYGYAVQANKEWNFDITDVDAGVQFTEYGHNGKYDWHHDVDWSAEDHRKLSVVIQLSDPNNYEGGGFEFKSPADPIPDELFRPRGSVLVFPSMYEHRVLPITSGTRYSLVTWIRGPKFK